MYELTIMHHFRWEIESLGLRILVSWHKTYVFTYLRHFLHKWHIWKILTYFFFKFLNFQQIQQIYWIFQKFFCIKFFWKKFFCTFFIKIFCKKLLYEIFFVRNFFLPKKARIFSLIMTSYDIFGTYFDVFHDIFLTYFDVFGAFSWHIIHSFNNNYRQF